VVAKDVKVAVTVPHLEVTMIGSQPAVDNFSDLDLGPNEPKRRGVSSPR
jgi:hypothetical protein